MLSKLSGRLTPAVSGRKRPGILAMMATSEMMIQGAFSDSLL